jgi:hypothetical protein
MSKHNMSAEPEAWEPILLNLSVWLGHGRRWLLEVGGSFQLMSGRREDADVGVRHLTVNDTPQTYITSVGESVWSNHLGDMR